MRSALTKALRPGLPWESRVGALGGAFRGIGGGAPASAAPSYTPASDPLSLLWWDPTTVSGAVSSWVDSIAGVAAVQATGAQQPAQSNTAIGGAYPGVAASGDILVAAGAGAVLSGKASLTLTVALVDATTTAGLAVELTANGGTTNGGFFLAPNDGGTGQIGATLRGTVGMTTARIMEPLDTVKVVSVGYSFATAGAGAVAFIRVNGVAQSLTMASSANAAGVAANASLHLFARSGLVAPYAGTMGHLVIRESVAQDAALAAAETYVGAQAGLVI